MASHDLNADTDPSDSWTTRARMQWEDTRVRWTVAIPKPGSMPSAAAGLDGNADSLEQVAHALVDTARAYLRRQPGGNLRACQPRERRS